MELNVTGQDLRSLGMDIFLNSMNRAGNFVWRGTQTTVRLLDTLYEKGVSSAARRKMTSKNAYCALSNLGGGIVIHPISGIIKIPTSLSTLFKTSTHGILVYTDDSIGLSSKFISPK